MSSTAPFGATVSSVAPSDVTAVERMAWFIVSPVVSAAATIVVPSMSPRTISAVRPGRRDAFRTARRSRTRFRSARKARIAKAIPSPTARPTRSVSTGMPKSSLMIDLADRRLRGFLDDDFVRVATRILAEDDEVGELRDLRLVEAREMRRSRGLFACPERQYQHLPL